MGMVFFILTGGGATWYLLWWCRLLVYNIAYNLYMNTLEEEELRKEGES